MASLPIWMLGTGTCVLPRFAIVISCLGIWCCMGIVSSFFFSCLGLEKKLDNFTPAMGPAGRCCLLHLGSVGVARVDQQMGFRRVCS
jgi:hypothetical protein